MSVSAETLPSACIFLFCCALDVSGHQPLCSPQPITACRCEGGTLQKRSDQVPDLNNVTPLEARAGANFECCVYKLQLANPTHYTFNE